MGLQDSLTGVADPYVNAILVSADPEDLETITTRMAGRLDEQRPETKSTLRVLPLKLADAPLRTSGLLIPSFLYDGSDHVL